MSLDWLMLAAWMMVTTWQVKGQQLAPSVAVFLENVDDKVFQSTLNTVNSSLAEMTTLHNITGLTPFQLFNKACTVASSGAVVIATQASCPTVLTLFYAVDTLGLGFIAEEDACDTEDAALTGADNSSIPVTHANQPNLDLVLVSTLDALDWRNVIVIYDKHDKYAYDRYLQGLEDKIVAINGFVQMFEVDVDTVEADVSTVMQYITEAGTYYQILVVCSTTCIKETLRMAIEIDSSGVEQELFSFAVSFLILAMEEDLDAILPVVQTLNHVTVITPPSKVLIDMTAVNKLMNAVNHSVNYLEQANNSDWETEATVCGTKLSSMILTDDMQRGISNFTWPGVAPFKFYAAMWSVNRTRRFEKVAEWTGKKTLEPQDIFPNKKFGLNGKHLIVGTNTWDPFVIYDVNSTTGYAGYCMDLLNMMSYFLNFTYELKEPDDGMWGTYVDGTYNGLIGQLIRKEVDVVAAPIVMSANKSYYVDFSKPFFVESHSAIVRYLDPEKKNWRIYLDPFQWDVWTGVVISIPAAGIILWAFHRLSAQYDGVGKKKKMGQLDESMWYSFGSILTQGSSILPLAQSGRFVVGFWLMYCLVVISSYSGNLVAFFTVSNPSLPFNTLREAVASDYKIGVVDGSYIYTYIMESEHGVFKEVADRIRYFNKTDPSVLSTDHKEHLAKVRAEKYVYIVDSTTIQVEITTNCKVDKIKETFTPVEYALAFQKNSAYRKAFNTGLELFIENGFEKRWRQTWWPYLSTCDRGLMTTSKPVSVNDMQGAFFLMAIILMLAMISLFFELGVWKAAKPKPDENSVEDQSTEMKWHSVRFNQYRQEYPVYSY